jgi:hypothetical protein
MMFEQNANDARRLTCIAMAIVMASTSNPDDFNTIGRIKTSGARLCDFIKAGTGDA